MRFAFESPLKGDTSLMANDVAAAFLSLWFVIELKNGIKRKRLIKPAFGGAPTDRLNFEIKLDSISESSEAPFLRGGILRFSYKEKSDSYDIHFFPSKLNFNELRRISLQINLKGSDQEEVVNIFGGERLLSDGRWQLKLEGRKVSSITFSYREERR